MQSGHNDERELIKNVEFEKDQWGNVKLAPIVEKILQMGFPVRDNLISYYSLTDSVYVHTGKEPLPAYTTIPMDDIDLS